MKIERGIVTLDGGIELTKESSQQFLQLSIHQRQVIDSQVHALCVKFEGNLSPFQALLINSISKELVNNAELYQTRQWKVEDSEVNFDLFLMQQGYQLIMLYSFPGYTLTRELLQIPLHAIVSQIRYLGLENFCKRYQIPTEWLILKEMPVTQLRLSDVDEGIAQLSQLEDITMTSAEKLTFLCINYYGWLFQEHICLKQFPLNIATWRTSFTRYSLLALGSALLSSISSYVTTSLYLMGGYFPLEYFLKTDCQSQRVSLENSISAAADVAKTLYLFVDLAKRKDDSEFNKALVDYINAFFTKKATGYAITNWLHKAQINKEYEAAILEYIKKLNKRPKARYQKIMPQDQDPVAVAISPGTLRRKIASQVTCLKGLRTQHESALDKMVLFKEHYEKILAENDEKLISVNKMVSNVAKLTNIKTNHSLKEPLKEFHLCEMRCREKIDQLNAKLKKLRRLVGSQQALSELTKEEDYSKVVDEGMLEKQLEQVKATFNTCKPLVATRTQSTVKMQQVSDSIHKAKGELEHEIATLKRHNAAIILSVQTIERDSAEKKRRQEELLTRQAAERAEKARLKADREATIEKSVDVVADNLLDDLLENVWDIPEPPASEITLITRLANELFEQHRLTMYQIGTEIYLPTLAGDHDLLIIVAPDAFHKTIQTVRDHIKAHYSAQWSYQCQHNDRTGARSTTLTYHKPASVHYAENTKDLDLAICTTDYASDIQQALRGRVINVASVARDLTTGKLHISPEALSSILANEVEILSDAIGVSSVSTHAFINKMLFKCQSLPGRWKLGDNLKAYSFNLCRIDHTQITLSSLFVALNKTPYIERLQYFWRLGCEAIIKPVFAWQHIEIIDTVSANFSKIEARISALPMESSNRSFILFLILLETHRDLIQSQKLEFTLNQPKFGLSRHERAWLNTVYNAGQPGNEVALSTGVISRYRQDVELIRECSLALNS